ncbi:hypothetical protein Rsub_09799 [Raphidocelis subcapitata]|uniref:Uncharacterized protein n=1 Tax=Raphidocelis subcapitata TaxID=307507 RepID=A0A2V0PDG4_9CHLO|nr:hypothetical protein Rsub_09799 [Raphidocelis subcapitata]|eukprot:GBF97002.1 hypothetical protein Rsub_09799 [Raphidocelis subcapitata]
MTRRGELGGGDGGGAGAAWGADVGGGGDGGEAHMRRAQRVLAAAGQAVVAQQRLMDSAGTAWHAVKYGNLELITQLFPNKCNVYARGPVGENVLHTAMLLNTPSTLAIARYLVKLYGPPLVNTPFQDRRLPHDPPSAYEGQTALHIAIVNKDIDMVKFLVAAGADIRARAWGPFFGPGGPMHYGEFPLSFAACTGQKEVVAHLKRHGAGVNADRDVHGNTALHMTVVHDQPDMFDFLVDYCAASDAVRNNAGLTPLVLAAHLGKMATFQHIYNRRRRAFYTFGRVTSYSLALREIDTVQDEEGYVPNALEVVLRKGHLDMLEEPLISILLRHKWEAFARTQFLLHFVGYLLLEVSQTILIWLISSRGLWNGPERASQEYVGFCLAIIMTLFEVVDYVDWSRECYQRRLTVSSPPPYQPPLYPIPGESQDAGAGRQGIFHRLSQRMMGGLLHGGGGSSGAAGGSASASAGAGAGAGVAGTPFAAAAAVAVAASGDSGDGGSGQNANRVRRRATPESPLDGSRRFDRPLSVTASGTLHPSTVQLTTARSGALSRGGSGGSGGGAPPPIEAASAASATGRSPRVAHVSFASPPGPVAEASEADGAAQEPEQQQRRQPQAAPGGADSDNEDEPDVVSVGLTGRRSAQLSGSPPRGARPGPAAAAAAPALREAGDEPPPTVAATAAAPPHLPAPAPRPVPARASTFPRVDAAAAAAAAVAASPGAVAPSFSGGLPAVASAPGALSAAQPKPGGGAAGHEGALQRQRTRARSGGGDLPSSVSALKRVNTAPGRHRGDAAGDAWAQPGATGGGGLDDIEAGGDATAKDANPHKGPLRALLETTSEGFARMLSDPWLFIWHTHLFLTFVHFITWQTTYGGVGGPGPASRAVKEFDDVVVSLMGLSGWLAVIYFFRGFKATGRLAVVLERCIVDVVRFVSLYVTSIFCTLYYLVYMATSAILLLNLLMAMIIRTYATTQHAAEAHWRRRWAIYTVKAERRMPQALVQRLRLGQPAWDPRSGRQQYSHVFETVQEDRGASKEGAAALDSQIRAVSDLLDGLRARQRGAGGGGGGVGVGVGGGGGGSGGGGGGGERPTGD